MSYSVPEDNAPVRETVSQIQPRIESLRSSAHQRRLASDFEVELFPYIVGRRAGLPHSSFSKFRFKKTLALIDQSRNLETASHSLGPGLCSALETLISHASPHLRSQLVSLKRDIYNNRIPQSAGGGEEITEYLKQHLSVIDFGKFQRWIQTRATCNELLSETAEAFADEKRQFAILLRRLLQKTEFRGGLALASPDLNYEYETYVRCPSPQRVPRANRTERSLLRYYSRCALKLSPFSSFTRSFMTHVLPEPESRKHDGRAKRLRGHRTITLNRAIIRHLAMRLAAHPECSKEVPIRIARQISVNEKSIVVLRHRYPQDESLRMLVPREDVLTIDKQPIVSLVSALLQDSGGFLTRGDLENQLAIACKGQANASDLVERLVQIGFLVHQIPLPQDGSVAIEALTNFLKRLDSPFAREVLSSLTSLQDQVSAFQDVPCAARSQGLRQINANVRGTFAKVGATTAWNGTLLYENVVEDLVRPRTVPREWTTPISDLQEFLQSYRWFLDVNLGRQNEMRNVLAATFAGAPVRFLEFLRTFTKAAFRSQPARELDELRCEFGSAISSCSAGDTVDLREIDSRIACSERAARILQNLKINNVFSVACYCQPLSENQQPMLLIDTFQNGCARAALRMSNTLSQQDRTLLFEKIQTTFARAWPDAEPCELRASFDYNGNLHPRLTNRVIDYLGEGESEPDSIPLSSLLLRQGRCQELLVIDTTKNRRIIPLDLGYMASVFAPLSYSLLSATSNGNVMSNRTFHPYTWQSTRLGSAGIKYFPRLVFGACVLRRKGWLVSADEIPRRQPHESDLNYFDKIRRWQHSVALPEEVFVHEPPDAANFRAAHWTRQMWNKRKPQYIHFGSQPFLAIFESAFADAPQIYIEEMLPERSNWRSLGLFRPTEYVAEFWIARHR